MALRYSSKSAAVAVAGTNFAHGLGETPTEWSFNHRGAPPAPLAATLYLAAVGSTNIQLASASGATTCDVFASVVHSVIQ